MKVLVGSSNPVKVKAVREVFGEYFGKVKVVGKEVETGVSEQPWEEEIREGARNRAEAAIGEADYGVGLEGGVVEMEGKLFESAWCVVVDVKGRVGYGGGLYFELPPKVAEKIRAGGELGPVMNEILSREDVKKKEGAIGIFSKGKLSRQQAYEHLVKQALLKFVSSEWWEEM